VDLAFFNKHISILFDLISCPNVHVVGVIDMMRCCTFYEGVTWCSWSL